eukprot:scaffold1940_cov312-Prasinococcus_capsulatus_cf.AAC.3
MPKDMISTSLRDRPNSVFFCLPQRRALGQGQGAPLAWGAQAGCATYSGSLLSVAAVLGGLGPHAHLAGGGQATLAGPEAGNGGSWGDAAVREDTAALASRSRSRTPGYDCPAARCRAAGCVARAPRWEGCDGRAHASLCCGGGWGASCTRRPGGI